MMKLKLVEDFNIDNNEKLYYNIASQVRKELIDKYSEDFLYGKCIEASDKIVDLLSKEGINATAVEGWVHYDCDEGCTDRDYDEHTWVETEDGYVIDVTATQFNHFMDEDYPTIIVQNELPYGYSYDEPNNYLDYSDGEWSYKSLIEESLTEAKKRKKKRKNQTQNNPVFKSVDDLKKWVKKRQKGMSPWGMFNTNAGNVPVGNAIFNGSFSSGGGSGAGVSDGGISNGGLSAPAGDSGGMVMGEALSNNDDEEKSYIEISSSSYLRQYKHLLDDHLDEFIAELYKFCDEKVYLNIINMLKEADIALPNPQQVLDRMIELGYVKYAQKSTLLQLEKDLGQQ